MFFNFFGPIISHRNVLDSKFAYGSQFSGEKNDLKIRYLVAEILSKKTVLFFLGHPVKFIWALFLQLPLSCIRYVILNYLIVIKMEKSPQIVLTVFWEKMYTLPDKMFMQKVYLLIWGTSLGLQFYRLCVLPLMGLFKGFL